jgi:hypothetical protein
MADKPESQTEQDTLPNHRGEHSLYVCDDGIVHGVQNGRADASFERDQEGQAPTTGE